MSGRDGRALGSWRVHEYVATVCGRVHDTDEAAMSTSNGAVEVIAIFGPTASGKSVVAEAVADELGTEVVSADAMQVYRGLPILTNQPRRPTRLVAIRSLGEEMSVGAYAALAHEAIDDLVATAGSVVVAGGTGLYLRAALGELDVPPPAAPEVRARVERRSTRIAAPPTSDSRRSIPLRQPPCTRTTAGGSYAPSSSRTRAAR